MCIRKFLVCFLLLAAGKSNMWKEITTRQLMSLRSMQGKRKSLRFGREFVHLWWFTLSKKIVYSLYCVEFFFFALLYSLFYLAMIFQLVVQKKKTHLYFARDPYGLYNPSCMETQLGFEELCKLINVIALNNFLWDVFFYNFLLFLFIFFFKRKIHY